jgi:hypothetical protein
MVDGEKGKARYPKAFQSLFHCTEAPGELRLEVDKMVKKLE